MKKKLETTGKIEKNSAWEAMKQKEKVELFVKMNLTMHVLVLLHVRQVQWSLERKTSNW